MNNLIKVKKVKFKTGLPDFIYSIEQWVNNGKWKGFLRDNCISIYDIDHVEDDIMSIEDFNLLPEWGG